MGVVLASAWGYAALTDAETLPVKYVRIDGEFKHLRPGRIEEIAVAEVSGGFFTVGVHAIRERLLSEAWVRDVSVRRVWPLGLRITVTEQEPVARWGDGGFLNDQGELFEPHSRDSALDLVQLTGPPGSELRVLTRLKETENALLGNRQRVERLSQDERLAWMFRIQDGPTVIVGRDDFSGRIRRYIEDFHRQFGDRLEEIKVVDLRYTNGFAVRTYKDPAQLGLNG